MRRWSRTPKETGLRAIGQAREHLLKEDGETIAHVAPLSGGRYWYWYGLGQNTCKTPAQSLIEAKAQVMAYLKEQAK